MSSEGQTGHVADLPALPSDWSWRPLRDLVNPSRGICYGIVQPGSHDPLGVPMVNSTDILSGCSSQSIYFRVSPELHKRFCRSELQGGELLVTLVGANFGQIATAPTYYRGYNVARPVGIVPVVDNAEFVLYALRSPTARHLMNTWANTTAQPTLNLKDLGNLPIPIPPRATSRAIAAILKSFDDRITLLRETNATLEAIAQALFKSWFVDFDPVRAKLAGRAPDGIDEATAALFPDRFEESELGDIPVGWQIGSILDDASLLSGGTPKTDRAEYWGGDIAWASAKDVSQSPASILVTTERTITQAGVDHSATRIIPALATVVVARGATTGRMVMLGDAMAMNQTCYALSSRHGTPVFLNLLFRTQIGRLVNAAHGSVFDTITTATFAQSRYARPPVALAQAFEMDSRSLVNRVLNNVQSIQSLENVRDTLLPRLISGQLRLPEAEALVEETAA